jgi:hypothetical protein
MPAKPSPPATTRPPRRRRWPFVALALVLLLGGLHAALWAWATARLEEGAAAWAGLRRAEGWQVAHGPATRGGWPLSARLTLDGVALRRDGIGWQAEHLTLDLSPGSPDRLRLGAGGRQALLAGDQAVPMLAEGMVADLPLGPRGIGIAGLPRDAALRAERLRLDLPAGPLELAALRLDLASGDGAGPGDPLVVLRGSVARVALPPGLAGMPALAALGPGLDRVSLDAALSGPWPGLAGPPALRAARWRDGGGTLELRALEFGWGAARAGMTAALALDGALQPAGEGVLRLAGAGAVLDALREAGLIGRREASGAQLLLAMMQRSPPEGGPPRLDLPVVLERRALSLAGMALGRLPPLSWPGAAR